MSYQLAPQVFVCVVSGEAIFLDLGRDRYLAVGGRAAQAVAAFLEHGAACTADLDRLAEAGLLAPAASPEQPPRRQAAAPSHSLVEQSRPGSPHGSAALLEVAISLGMARWDLRRRSLAGILKDLERHKVGDPEASRAAAAPLIAVAAAFNAARRKLPFKPNCLPDSLALLACLRRRGHGADLVFGVKLHPFSAHCWVQAAGVVLNDALDHATLHTPILVI